MKNLRLWGALVLAGLLMAGGWGMWHTGRWQYLMALSGDPAQEYEYGRWLVAHDRKGEALMWMSQAAEHNEPRAMVWLGLAYQGGGYFAYPDFKQSFYWFKEAANRNNVVAMVAFAGMFEGSPYVRKQASVLEANTAAKVWYMRAANEGAGIAIDRMVKVYENGELGEVKSAEKTEQWRKTPRKSDEYWKEQME